MTPQIPRPADVAPMSDREGRRWRKPAKLMLVQRERTGKHQAMKARRRAGGIVERARLAQGKTEGHGPALFAQQRRVIADRKDRRKLGGCGERRVDLAGASRLAPPIEHARGQVRRVSEVAI